MSRETRSANFGARFSRNAVTPSRTSALAPRVNTPRLSILWASIGWSAPSIPHIICRVSATATGAVLSAISRAIARAAGRSSPGGCTALTSPPARASSAGKTRPEKFHSSALAMPTMRGRNQLEQASGTMPRRTKTKPKRASVEAIRMSMGRSMVTPMPTAGPLTAAITGFSDAKILSVTRPPASRAASSLRSGAPSGSVGGVSQSRRAALSKAAPPAERSAPAQKARPAPVTMIARTVSSASAWSKASMSSLAIASVKALSLSGRLSVIVKTPTEVSQAIVEKDILRSRPKIASERAVAAVDHEAVGSVIRRERAHQIDRDPAKIRWLAEAPHRDPWHHVGEEFLVASGARRHVGLDPAGQDSVGGDAVAGVLDRERARQRVHCRFRRGVMLVARRAEEGGHARGRDESAETVAALGAPDHVPQYHLVDVEDAVEIGREHTPPVVLGAVDERVESAARNAGVGEAAVDPTEGLEGRGESSLDRLSICDVAGARFGRGAELREVGERVAVLLLVAAPDRDRATGARERLGHAKPDAAVAPGNDRDASREIEIGRHGLAPLPRSSLSWRRRSNSTKHGAHENSTAATSAAGKAWDMAGRHVRAGLIVFAS